MARFLIDESLPRLLGSLLRAAGHDPRYALDLGLRGQDDKRIFSAAQQLESTLISRDNDFSNLLQFPLGGHYGIVVVRYPSETRINVVASETVRAISGIQGPEFSGGLIIIEPGRVRVRRP